MKIVVIGGTGRIGSRLVARLKRLRPIEVADVVAALAEIVIAPPRTERSRSAALERSPSRASPRPI